MAKKNSKTSTQKYLPFKEIREGVIIMKDGSLTAVLMVNAINFNLKSPDEQTALLGTFQNFLNSLGFPIQILMQSRILDLDAYLTSLEQRSASQTNELLQAHIKEYIEFVRELIGVANIMNKAFYVVVSDKNISTSGQSILSRLLNRKSITSTGMAKEASNNLLANINLLANNLAGMGLSSVLLNTTELIDLLYATYNPDIARRQKLFNISNVDANVITTLAQSSKKQL